MKPLSSVTDLRLRSLLRLQSSSFEEEMLVRFLKQLLKPLFSWTSSSEINQTKRSHAGSSQATSGIFSCRLIYLSYGLFSFIIENIYGL